VVFRVLAEVVDSAEYEHVGVDDFCCVGEPRRRVLPFKVNGLYPLHFLEIEDLYLVAEFLDLALLGVVAAAEEDE
jgi:hypothetical protein